MNFYIGDPHLGHEAIICLRVRPLASADEMDVDDHQPLEQARDQC